MQRIQVKGNILEDSLGRERIFHGINMVFKGKFNPNEGKTEYIPEWNESTFRWLADNGFNLIRLGIIWAAIEPEPGIYDEKYLNWVDSTIQICKSFGIYVFLDMHQDLFSEKYSDGAPTWATLDDGLMHYTGDLWSDSYLFSDAVKKAFDRFWGNDKLPTGEGIQDHYASMWGMLADRYSHHDNLIGYDVMNEPFPGSTGLGVFTALLDAFAKLTGRDMPSDELMGLFADEEAKLKLLMEIDDYELYSAMTSSAALVSEGFESIILDSFYNKVLVEIRAKSNQGAFFLENSYFSNMGIQSSVKKVENGGPQVFAPHGYDLVVDSPAVCIASNNRVDVIFDNHKKVQERLGVPVIVGEWGAHDRYEEGLGHIIHLLSKFDKYKWSHTYWAYFKGIENAPVMNVLRRPYPVAVAGEILEYGYDYNTRSFRLAWCQNKDRNKTVIFVPDKPVSMVFSEEYSIEPISKSSKAYLITLICKIAGNKEFTVNL